MPPQTCDSPTRIVKQPPLPIPKCAITLVRDHFRDAGMKSSKQQVKLFVGTPCYGGVVTMRYMQSVYVLLLQAPRLEISVQLDLIAHEALITRGRNCLVSKFLDQADATHLFFIDADIAFDISQVTRMLAFDQDLVAGMYPLKEM